jgi:hypothetical protein
MATITVHLAALASNLICAGVGQLRPSSSATSRMVLPGFTFLNVARLPSALRQLPPSRRSISFLGPYQALSEVAVMKAAKQSLALALMLLVGQIE